MRQRFRIVEQVFVPALFAPGVTQTVIEPRQHFRENFAQVVRHAPAFTGDVRLGQADLTSAPQPLDGGLDRIADLALLGGSPHGVFALDQL